MAAQVVRMAHVTGACDHIRFQGRGRERMWGDGGEWRTAADVVKCGDTHVHNPKLPAPHHTVCTHRAGALQLQLRW